MDQYYPNTRLALPAQGRVRSARRSTSSRQGLPTWEQALERLLAAAEEPVTP